MDIILFESGKLPHYIKAKAITNPFLAAVTAAYPIISIKGKVFHVQRGDERILVHRPDDPSEPATSIEVVIIGYNSSKSKVYYSEGYIEGSTEKPTCYSNDGVAPAADAQRPQAKKCALCPHNQWGSRITESGGKGKACADYMRLAVVPVGQLNDAMLLKVPASSLKNLGQYGDLLAKRGVEPKYVVTKIGFDHSVAHPVLTFRPVRFVTENELEMIEDTISTASDVINQIIGVGQSTVYEYEDAEPKVEPKVQTVEPQQTVVKVEPKVQPKKEVAEPQQTVVKVEPKVQPKKEVAEPQQTVVKVEPKVQPKKEDEDDGDDISIDEIEAILDNINFDD